MARPKRNASTADLDNSIDATQPAKKGRHNPRKQVVETAATSRPKRASAGADGAPKTKATKSAPKGKATGAAVKPAKSTMPAKSPKPTKSAKPAKAPKSAEKATNETETASNGRRSSNVSVEIEKHKKEEMEDEKDQDGEEEADRHLYWLMKTEPESRIEKGKDVKFSIDDLKAATKPEGWDGKLVQMSPARRQTADLVNSIGVRNLAGKGIHSVEEQRTDTS